MSYPTIIDKFCGYEQTRPHQLFLAEPVNGQYKKFSWQQAGNEVRRMATALNAMGFGAGDKVALLSKNCAHWVMADLAITMAGCISVPLYPNLTPEALRELILHSESKAIFIGKLDNPAELRQGIPEELIGISFPFYPNSGCINWDELIASHEPLQGIHQPDPLSTASIVYTSGTTGHPKGVMQSLNAVGFAVDSFLQSCPGLDNETFFSYLPLCHVAERMLVESGAIFTGSAIYFVESMDTFAKNLADARPTIFLAVPRIWEKLQEGILSKMPQKKLSRLLRLPIVGFLIRKFIRRKLGFGRCKHVFTGASPINIALLEWYAKLGLPIQEAYGMTENICLSNYNRKGNIRFGTVGQPFPGVTVRLGEDNEVQAKSPASMLGYYKEPELTAESFDDGFLKTGDEGSIDSEGFLTITGRIKDQFKTSKGKYIMPAPIELKLLETGPMAQVCVVGSGMPNAIALATLSETAKQQEPQTIVQELQSLLAKLNKELESYEKLAKIVVLPQEWTIANGLLTPTLKIKRKMIEAAFGGEYEDWIKRSELVILA